MWLTHDTLSSSWPTYPSGYGSTTSFFTRSRLNKPSGRQLMWTKRQMTSEEKAQTHTEIWHSKQQWLSKNDALWELCDYRQWMLQILATALLMLTIQCRYWLRRSKRQISVTSRPQGCLWFSSFLLFSPSAIFSAAQDATSNNNNNNNNKLQLGCHPVAVVILHVYKIWNWWLINLIREGYM